MRWKVSGIKKQLSGAESVCFKEADIWKNFALVGSKSGNFTHILQGGIFMKREIRRKGFTLVELLIVIVVIGILSAMMMISSSEAVSSAKATNIVNNLRAVKVAALAYYADHSDKFDKKNLTMTNLLPYLKKTNSSTVETADNSLKGYGIMIDGDDNWYAYCDLAKVTGATNANNWERRAILRKLGDRSTSAGLEFADSNEANSNARKIDIAVDGTAKYEYVYMWVR